ncbi:MAG: hypothetical protein ABMB14_38945, partial [Myxococcota bacterium]
AHASSWFRQTIAEQASTSAVVAVGTVSRIDIRTLDDGCSLTQLRMTVDRVLRGSVSSGRITVVLPGARIDGQWTGAVGIPEASVGDTLLVFGAPMTDTEVQMAAGPQSVFRLLRTGAVEIAADFEGNPVVDPGCDQDRVIARPMDQAPALDDRSTAEATPAVPLDRVFVSQPESVGLDWTLFVDQIAACVATQPASDLASTDVGGGW